MLITIADSRVVATAGDLRLAIVVDRSEGGFLCNASVTHKES